MWLDEERHALWDLYPCVAGTWREDPRGERAFCGRDRGVAAGGERGMARVGAETTVPAGCTVDRGSVKIGSRRV